MATVEAKPQLTPAQFRDWERIQPERPLYEYYDGEVVEMPGTTRAHGRISVNLTRVLANLLVDRPEELFQETMRVSVNSGRAYVYPDVVVSGAEPRFLDGIFDTLLNPVLLIEVLSPSTEATDRGKKLPRPTVGWSRHGTSCWSRKTLCVSSITPATARIGR